MASIGGESNGRETTIEINLVPFIDLMSVCIIFLLVTAVWTQVSMIQLGSSIYAKKNDSGQVEPPPRSDVTIKVDVKSTGYFLHVGRSTTAIPKLPTGYDEAKLLSTLKEVKTQYPDKNDAIISVADEINYEEMIRGMDGILNSGFAEVSVATGEEG